LRRFHRLPLLLLFVALGSVFGASGERPVLFHTPPPQVLPGEPLAVEGLLVRGGDIDQVSLSFRGPNKPFEVMPMERVYGDLFRATLPAEKVAAPGLEYFVEGVTRKGAKVPLFMSEARPARVLVVPGARVPKPKPAPPAEGTATARPSEEPELAPLEKPAPKPTEPKAEPAPKPTEPKAESAPKPAEPKVVAAPKPPEPKPKDPVPMSGSSAGTTRASPSAVAPTRRPT